MRTSTTRHPTLLRHARAIVAGLALVAGIAAASSTSSDQSDLWWNPAESGWGIQFIQQYNTIFATMFVYAASGQPEFYGAVLERGAGLTWSGKVYRSTGPWWGGVFNPAAVVESEVGTMSWQAQTLTSGRLEYTISGVNVVKQIERMSFANDHLGASYAGNARHDAIAGVCPSTGPTTASVQFTHGGGATASATLVIGARSCAMATGNYRQQGQFGQVYGPHTCTDGETGSAQIFEIELAVDTITFRYDYNGNGPGGICRVVGYFAGVRQ